MKGKRSFCPLCLAGVLVAATAIAAAEDLAELVKQVRPSVVLITCYDDAGNAASTGSGFFLNKEGHIVTNRHVVERAARIEAKLSDAQVFPLTHIQAEDVQADLVLLSGEIPAKDIRPITVAKTVPEPGEHVAIIGNPLGLEQSVSDGVVSAVREVPNAAKYIQTTAPISPGSSGSPVVNMKGELIGVATLMCVQGQNLNFAISAESVAKLPTTGKGTKIAEWHTRPPAGQKQDESAESCDATGDALAGLERYEEAMEAYKQAIRINPDYADAHFSLGWAYFELRRYEEAIAAYKQGLRIKPDRHSVYGNIEAAYLSLGRFDDAVETCKQALRINPDDEIAYNNLASAYLCLKRYDDALETSKQAIRINPDNETAHSSLADAYDGLGRHADAIEAYKQAIRIQPDYAVAHYNLGFAYLSIGDTSSALDEYKILKNLDAKMANYLFNGIYK